MSKTVSRELLHFKGKDRRGAKAVKPFDFPGPGQVVEQHERIGQHQHRNIDHQPKQWRFVDLRVGPVDDLAREGLDQAGAVAGFGKL